MQFVQVLCRASVLVRGFGTLNERIELDKGVGAEVWRVVLRGRIRGCELGREVSEIGEG